MFYKLFFAAWTLCIKILLRLGTSAMRCCIGSISVEGLLANCKLIFVLMHEQRFEKHNQRYCDKQNHNHTLYVFS